MKALKIRKKIHPILQFTSTDRMSILSTPRPNGRSMPLRLFSYARCCYMWLLISSHYFKNSLERSLYVLISTFFLKKSSFSNHINIFVFIFGCISAVSSTFYRNLTNFSKICTICMCRNRAGALPDFLQKIFKKMFDNGYMHPKSVLPVTYVVWTSAYGWLNLIFWRKKFVNSQTFCYLPTNFYPSHSRDPARCHLLWKGSQSFSITKAMMPVASSVYSGYINLENWRGWRN
jgi:hypothetical protein